MALGEELLFYNGDDADTFLKFLRKQNCSAVKRTTNVISTEVFLYGSIEHFLQLVDTLQNTAIDGDHASHEGVIELRSEMDLRAHILKDFFGERKQGARIDEGPEWEALTTLLKRESPSSETLSEEERSLIRDRYLLLALLDENNLIDAKGEGIYLKEAMDPSFALTQYPAHLLPEVDEELLIKNTLSRRINTYAETVYTVTLGSEIVLFDGMEMLESTLNELDVDPESAATAVMNIASKKVIVDRVLSLLRDRKTMTRDDIIEALQHFHVQVPDTVDTFVYQLDRSFIDDVLSDLRKLKAIQGKDTKIRCTG